MKKRGIELKGWRYGMFIGAFVGAIGLAMYPIAIYPMMHPEYYQKRQQINRAGMDIDAIQPGGMKRWSDPFGRKKAEE